MPEQKKQRWRDNLGFLVNQLAARMQAAFEAELAPHKISRLQWTILRDLYDAPHRPAQLANQLGADRAVITRVLEGLDGRGLISRTIDPKDRRQIDVALTDAGRELAQELIRISRQVNGAFLRDLPREKGEALIEVLAQILERTKKRRGESS